MILEALSAASSAITVYEFGIKMARKKGLIRIDDGPSISISIVHNRKEISLHIVNNGPTTAEKLKVSCPKDDEKYYCDKLLHFFNIQFDLTPGAQVNIPFRSMYLAGMKEMLEGYVPPNEIKLTFNCESNGKSYEGNVSISIDLLDLSFN